MPTLREDAQARRAAVAPTARPLWLVAVWTGAGAALLGMAAAIAAVAACWLPVSGGVGSAQSAVRAGVLTFLAALHGGITVDAVPTAFVPLGMTLLVGVLAWRAGRALAAAAAPAGEQELRALGIAAASQAAAFAIVCGLAAQFATLGTSSVSVGAAASAGFVLFAVSGGVAFIRASPRTDAIAVPEPIGRAARAAAIALAVQAAGACLLVAGALIVHHARVEELSRQVGGGWSGLPVLLLGALAAPNAVLAGSSYLTGPGFALGTASHVSLTSTAHGTLPAFPVLGGVPSGHGATWPVWVLAAVTPLLAGMLAALAVGRGGSVVGRLRDCLTAALFAGCAAALLGRQGGGAIGSGRLSVIGPSPWQFGLATALELALTALLATALLAVADSLRGRMRAATDESAGVVSLLKARLARAASAHSEADDDVDGDGELAG